METDSIEVFNFITTSSTPWFYQDLESNIRRLLVICRASLAHVYREQNHAADFIAKMGFNHDSMELALEDLPLFFVVSLSWKRMVYVMLDTNPFIAYQSCSFDVKVLFHQ